LRARSTCRAGRTDDRVARLALLALFTAVPLRTWLALLTRDTCRTGRTDNRLASLALFAALASRTCLTCRPDDRFPRITLLATLALFTWFAPGTGLALFALCTRRTDGAYNRFAWDALRAALASLSLFAAFASRTWFALRACWPCRPCF